MTISTPHIDISASRQAKRRQQAGFTLAEIMVSTGLSGLILAGILSTFLMIGRTGYAAGNYSEMEVQTRRALEIFGNDAREATNIRWNDPQSITLFVPAAGSSTTAVTYAYDNVSTSETFGAFYRTPGEPSAGLPRTVLVREVAPDFSFQRFKLEQAGVSDNTAANDLETKQIQVTMRARRARVTTVTATQASMSARYILRNKRVSN
jgi:Tfp pilus assembly protein PilW